MSAPVAKLARDTVSRAWADVHAQGPIAAAEAASSSLTQLLIDHASLHTVPEISLRLALSAAIQAVPEEIALSSTSAFSLLSVRVSRAVQGLLRPELKDLRNRARALVLSWLTRDEEAFQLSQLVMGNWIARQVGLDHHEKSNESAIWALGGVVAIIGVRVAEDIFIKHGGRIATLSG
ncbi:MAG: hypothetical protein ACREOC_18130 [Gemmatimonadales bacterium]